MNKMSTWNYDNIKDAKRPQGGNTTPTEEEDVETNKNDFKKQPHAKREIKWKKRDHKITTGMENKRRETTIMASYPAVMTATSAQFQGFRRKVNLPKQKPLDTIFTSASNT